MNIWIYSILGCLSVCIVSLLGADVLFLNENKLKSSLQFLVSLAVGFLLGDAFIHLIPDAVEKSGNLKGVLLYTVAGILLFFLLEKVIRWRHQHHVYTYMPHQPAPLAKMNLYGDAIHNFIDGILIAGSFMVNPALGITTTLAIVIHEIPQEIADIGALVYGGYKPAKAVWYNFLCSLTSIAGAVIVLLMSSYFKLPVHYLLPIAAGGFIYIATSDLMPELHNKALVKHQMMQGVLIGIGVCFMTLISFLDEMIHF